MFPVSVNMRADWRYGTHRISSAMAIPILTYHAQNIAGNDYANNNHVAFAEDLRLLSLFQIRFDTELDWVTDSGSSTVEGSEECNACTVHGYSGIKVCGLFCLCLEIEKGDALA